MPRAFAAELLERFGEPSRLTAVGFLCAFVRLDGRMDRLRGTGDSGDGSVIHASSEISPR